MRIHHLQHVSFEGLGSMGPYLKQKGYNLTSTHLYLGQELPSIDDLDWLIVMGGPMGVYDGDQYPWLKKEKSFIRDAMEAGKVVLGICLGAQFIADVLHAKVVKNKYREIGWFPIHRAVQAEETVLGAVLPETMEVFHWHGDTFDIPAEASLLASSEACRNQGFIIDDRIVGLQFHLETTLDSARALIDNCGNELNGSRFVQTEDQIISEESRFDRINAVMHSVLDLL